MRVLFVCTSNRLRSPTAQSLFAERPGLEVSSAGLDSAAVRVLDANMAEAADVIFVMERRHRDQIKKRFRFCLDKVVVLGIPDEYEHDQPELVTLLLERVQPFLDNNAST